MRVGNAGMARFELVGANIGTLTQICHSMHLKHHGWAVFLLKRETEKACAP